MIRIYYLLLLLALTNTLSAQPLMSHTEMHNYLTEQVLQKQALHHTAAKTTVIKERLTGTSSYYLSSGSFTIYDSTFMGYGGSQRGSKFDFNRMIYYFQAAIFQFGPVAGFYTYAPPQLMIKADTSWSFYVSGTSATLNSALYYTFDASQNVLTRHYYYQDTATIGYGTSITYNATGQPEHVLFYTDTFGHAAGDSTQFRVFTYNSSGQVVSDSISYRYSTGWRRYVKYIYSYDGSGNVTKLETYYADVTGTLWKLYNTTNMTYSGGMLQTAVTDTGVSHGLYVKDTFGYSGTSFYTLDYKYMRAGGTWDTSTFTTKTVNSSLLPDTVKAISKTGSTISHSVNYFVYDSYDQPILEHDSTLGTTPTSYFKYYYYQTYDAVHIPEVLQGSEDITLYPNPANNVLHINRGSHLNSSILRYYITDNAGRQVGAGSILPGSFDVPLQHLYPGYYFITVKAETGRNIKTIKFIKE